MLSYERLVAEHQEIESDAADLLQHAGRRPLDPAAIAKTRWSFSRKLLTHLTKEDLLLYPMLRRSPLPEVAALAERAIDDVGGLGDAVKDYMRRWTSDSMTADPDGFERDTQHLVAALRDRILREESQLYRHIPGAPAEPKVDGRARAA
ncbi:hemerythrin domain-containing protein [uncultured Sphingomonas sp.]|uniref:hemerythrin domain-containing protein n=1 Tax=uncultured Sphingomonas sp. TaxID=158754 RepID=UPI00258FD035|nr:hemerythrin domain-containing protein [uncultured Sphingomonas sp.]